MKNAKGVRFALSLNVVNAAKEVLQWDWSDNDDDACAHIEALRETVRLFDAHVDIEAALRDVEDEKDKGELKPVQVLADALNGFYEGKYTAADLMQMETLVAKLLKDLGEDGKIPAIPIKTIEDAISILMVQFLQVNPPNYMSTGVDYQGEMFSVTVQREKGETPTDQNARLKKYIEELEQELAATKTATTDRLAKLTEAAQAVVDDATDVRSDTKPREVKFHLLRNLALTITALKEGE